MTDFQKFILFSFGCLSSFFLGAQEPLDIKWSESLTMTSSTLPVFAKADSSGFFVFRLEGQPWDSEFKYEAGSAPILQRFTPELKFISAEPVKDWFSKDEGNYVFGSRLLSFNKKNWMLRLQADQAAGSDDIKQRIIAQEIDFDRNAMNKQPVALLDWVTSAELFVMNSYYHTDIFGSKLAMIYFPDGKRNHFIVKVFNRRLAPVWQKEISLPFKEEVFEPRAFVLGRTGTLYCEARVYDELPEKSEDPRNLTISNRKEYADYSSILLAFSAENDNAELVKLDLFEGKFRETALTEDSSGIIHCFGFFSEKNYEKYDGWADVSFDPVSKNVNVKGPFPFPAVLMSKVSLEKDGMQKSLPAFAIRDFQWRPDNTFEVWGEYHEKGAALHILGFRIDSSLQKAEGIRIAKSQAWSTEQEANWAFAKAHFYNDETILAYNADLKKTEGVVKLFLWPLHGEPEEITVAEPDISVRKSGFYIVPRGSHQVDDHHFIILAEAKNRKKHWIGLVKRN